MSAIDRITIFLCGDFMTGRGIDQILPHPVEPTLHERCVRDARTYIRLAEERVGHFAAPVDFSYVWGDALAVLERVAPVVRVINLETSVTTSDEHWEQKPIHYRMHPANINCLTIAGIDCCSLANNHVLDWGYSGLLETMRVLQKAEIKAAGAGADAEEAAAPAVLSAGQAGRILVFAFGTATSGIPTEWAATPEKPGINFLPDLSDETILKVTAAIERHARSGDVVIVSVHWGANWGHFIPESQIDFAHGLIDRAGVDIVHGHSSHHVKGLEIYKGRLILYGCGDFLNDYEGVGGHESYRPDLTLMHFPMVDVSTGALAGLRLVPLQIRHFRLTRAGQADATWLQSTLNRESRRFGVNVVLEDDGVLAVHWNLRERDRPD